MPDILEDEFKKTLSNIKDFTIKSNNENTSISEIEKYLIEAADKNSSQEKSEKEHGDDLGYYTNSNNTSLEHEQDFEVDSINNCCSDSNVEDLSYVKFSKGIQNFPNNPKQECDQSSLKNGEDEYNAEAEKTAISCAESVLQTDETYSDSSDWSSEENSSSYDQDPYLTALETLLTESEKSLIDEFYREVKPINIGNRNSKCQQRILEHIRDITNKYLEQEIRLNVYCSYGNYTVTDLILEKIADVIYPKSLFNINCNNSKIAVNIIRQLLLKGGRERRDPSSDDEDFDSCLLLSDFYKLDKQLNEGDDVFSTWKKTINKLESVAYKSVINKNKSRDDFEVAIDNGYFYIKYQKNSVVELTKVTNNKIIEDLNSEYKLNLKVGILQIGISVIRVEKVGEQRNYTDVPQGVIKMSFTAEVEDKIEKISILLHPDKEDNSKIKVELNAENQKKFNKLKDKSSLGKNCFLGGKSVIQAIQDKEFIKHESYKSATPASTPTLLEQASVSNVFDNVKGQFMQFQKYLFGG